MLIRMASFAAVLACVCATTGQAATPEERCQGKKLKLSGIYAACRIKADAKATFKGEAADYSKCEETLATKFDKAEQDAGPGACPTEGDGDPIAQVIDAATREVAEQLTAPDPGCPPGYRDRTVGEVIQDWLAAYSAQNVPLLLCNYHPTAHVIDDQGILVGYADIVDAFSSLWNLFDGVSPTIHAVDVFGESARMLWSLDAGWIEIEDGSDTFLIQRGRIRFQTRHGSITFNGPPPE